VRHRFSLIFCPVHSARRGVHPRFDGLAHQRRRHAGIGDERHTRSRHDPATLALKGLLLEDTSTNIGCRVLM
jgi:hypothetical protein